VALVLVVATALALAAAAARLRRALHPVAGRLRVKSSQSCVGSIAP
jgi:hypothetical protein